MVLQRALSRHVVWLDDTSLLRNGGEASNWEVGMTETRWRVWLVLSILIVAVPAGAGVVADCTGQPNGTPCTDTDGDICSIAACDMGLCEQNFSMQTPGTTCPDTDENACTIPSCNLVGNCSQSRARAPEGTACTDPEGRPGRCDGVVTCVVGNGAPAPALSASAVACLSAMLLVLGFWRLRRRSLGG